MTEKPKLPDGWRLGKVTQRQLVDYEDRMREAVGAMGDVEMWTAARRQLDMVSAAVSAGWFTSVPLEAGESVDDLEPNVVRRVFGFVLSCYSDFISIDPNG